MPALDLGDKVWHGRDFAFIKDADSPRCAGGAGRMTPVLTGIAAAAPAIAMLAAFACLIGGGVLIARQRDAKKGVLMLVMGVVLIANVVIWTL